MLEMLYDMVPTFSYSDRDLNLTTKSHLDVLWKILYNRRIRWRWVLAQQKVVVTEEDLLEAEKRIKEALYYLERSQSVVAATVLDKEKRQISIKLRGYP